MTASNSGPPSRTVLARRDLLHFSFSFSQSPLLVFLVLVLLSSVQSVNSQLVNGQSFTNGLSIINAPAPGSQFHASSNLPISIEVSGNGKLPLPATTPGSNLPSRFDLLEIFLVSSQASINMTVASGPDLLTKESGSVRHLDFQIPACLPAASYNLTFYEWSHINDTALLVITPVPINIDNKNGNNNGEPCVSLNELQPQPQPGSALPQSPFLVSNPIPIVTSAGGGGGAPSPVTTVNPASTVGPLNPGGSSGFVTLTSGFATTMLVTSVFTTTAPGQTSASTATVTSQVTTTIQGGLSGGGASGFVPANGARRVDGGVWSLGLILAVCVSYVLTWAFV